MKVKVFHIRLVKEHQQQDEDAMNAFINNTSVKKTSTQLVTGPINYWSILVFYDNEKTTTQTKTSTKIFYPADAELTEEEKKIYGALKQWRFDKAKELGIEVYQICHNAELVAIAKEKPQIIEDLIKIKGFAKYKVEKFGADIIAVLNSI